MVFRAFNFLFVCFRFLFCRTNGKKEYLDENYFHHCYLITAMFKVLSQQLQGKLATAFDRHCTAEDCADMDRHRC